MSKNTNTPPQPAAPPKGTSPSKSIQHAADTSWDSWGQHSSTTAQQAIANDKATIRKPIPTGGGKE